MEQILQFSSDEIVIFELAFLLSHVKMGVERDGSKNGGGYVGGFFQLFDWTAKSRKKLFSSKSDFPGTIVVPYFCRMHLVIL